MSQVLDYSFGRPNVTNIKNAGFVGVMRYLSHDPAKNMSVSEAQQLDSVGLAWGLVWESTAQSVTGGFNQGVADAQTALGQSNTLSYSGPIYFAIDYDAPESDQPVINEYFKGAASVVGAGRVGGYGGFYPVKRLFDAGLIVRGWQTIAWSGGNHESRCSLYQNGNQIFSADVNDVLNDNWNKEGNVPASQDKVDETVIRLEYNNALLRDATQAEVEGWLNTGVTVEEFMRQVQTSPEHEAVIAKFHEDDNVPVLKPGVYKVN
jgi:hypothetical protein